MKVIFTGTGSGKASLKRNHSSFLISTRSYNLLVDAGDGISKALLSARIPFNSITGILLTHLHADHYSGLASLIVQMKMNKRKEQLDIFVHKDISGTVRNFIYQSYLYKVPSHLLPLIKTAFEKPMNRLKDILFISVPTNKFVGCYDTF